MTRNKILFKSATILSLAMAGAPVVGVVGSVVNVLPGVVAHAAVDTTKAGSLSTAAATAVINKVEESGQNKAITMDYSVDVTLPKDVKSGDTVRVSTVNLGDFIPAGETKAPVTIEGVEVGTLSRVENNNKRYEQNSPETTLAQKKSANIEAGTQDNSYLITFNSKASEYANKKVTLKSNANLVYATTVSKDTNIRAQIFVNGKLLATKDYKLSATAPTPEVKSQKSAIDYSRNSRIQVVKSGDTTKTQNYLGLIVMPLDRDYEKGSTIEVTLPADSMIKFAAATDDQELPLTHFPVIKDSTEKNSNNVYLYNQETPKLRAKSISDNKVVYEVTDGTLRKGDSYVGLPNQTGVNFVLTEKAASKLSKDGKSIGDETVTSVMKSAKGEAGETQGNQLRITINGATVDAEGIKDLVAKKITTKWVVEESNKNLKDPVTDTTPKAKEDFKDYTYTTTKTDDDGNVTHYYRPATKTVTTEWIYTNGEILKEKVTDEKAHPKEEFPGAVYKETKVDKDGNTVHIYSKETAPTEEIVTNHVEFGTSKVLKDQEKGSKPKAEIDGYVWKETKTDDAGNVTHYYEATKSTDDKPEPKPSDKDEKELTRYLEVDTNKVLSPEVDGKQPKKDIEGYEFVETKSDKDDAGNVVTTHYYKAKPKVNETVTTKYVDADTLKDIKDPDEGSKPKADIDGYEFKETKTDDKGNVTHFYVKKSEEVKPVTKFVEQGTNTEIATQEDGDKPKKDIEGYEFVETKKDDKTGVTTHYYKKAAKASSSSSKSSTTPSSSSSTKASSSNKAPDVKQADRKAAVQTGSAISSITGPLMGVIATATAGIGAFIGLKRKK